MQTLLMQSFSVKSWETHGQEINFLFVSNITIVYYVKKIDWYNH
jgi:hypothetical protein